MEKVEFELSVQDRSKSHTWSMVWMTFRQRTQQGPEVEVCVCFLTKQGVWVETARVKYKTILCQMVESLGCYSRARGL